MKGWIARFSTIAVCVLGLLAGEAARAQQQKVIIDQDARGPATTDQGAIALALQDPNLDVLGITVVSGDQWRDEEVAHTLRLLELIGRTDVPVVPGAVFPLIRTQAASELYEKLYRPFRYMGAYSVSHNGPFVVPQLREGNPTTKPLDEDATEFLIQNVHKYPHQVTIFALGPLTDIALAVRSDPQFASLTKELVIMGGSINPVTDNAEYTYTPHREFNFWFDPEASSIALHAPWPKVVVTPVDVSVQTRFTPEMVDQLSHVHTPLAQYLAKYERSGRVAHAPAANSSTVHRSPGEYLWDQLAVAAWIDPTLITEWRDVYMDVDTIKGVNYGNTVTFGAERLPVDPPDKVAVQMKVDWPRFRAMFMRMVSAPTPGAKNPEMPLTTSGK